MTENIVTKQCSKCKSIKPLNEFHRDRKSLDGKQSYCKVCNKTYQKIYMRTYHLTEKGKQHTKKFLHSEKGQAYSRTIYRKQRKKKIASGCVRTKIRNGLMEHPSNLKCAYCKNMAQQYHHHRGYSRKYRYVVVPICIKCHSHIHNPRT